MTASVRKIALIRTGGQSGVDRAAGLKDVPVILRWISTMPDGTKLCVGGPGH